ncbi:hypothetical protein EYF80_011635 [Liparis tanakae]|uniref:Uncharacterized protein n=1 Tax=Liparis tanakae TaxID=230148 RepID=A0A4Z2IJD8_9TELE|nr:hypothetical protein EYF80_011635 [Liparis tanakae]
MGEMSGELGSNKGIMTGREMLQRNHHFNVVVGEVSRFATNGSLKPVLINLIDQGDDVTLVEAQLAFVLWLKVEALRLGVARTVDLPAHFGHRVEHAVGGVRQRHLAAKHFPDDEEEEAEDELEVFPVLAPPPCSSRLQYSLDSLGVSGRSNRSGSAAMSSRSLRVELEPPLL